MQSGAPPAPAAASAQSLAEAASKGDASVIANALSNSTGGGYALVMRGCICGCTTFHWRSKHTWLCEERAPWRLRRGSAASFVCTSLRPEP